MIRTSDTVCDDEIAGDEIAGDEVPEQAIQPGPSARAAPSAGDRVPMGEVTGVYGVHGWIRVHSFTEPDEGIFGYRPWQLEPHANGRSMRTVQVEQWRRHGAGFVAQLRGIADRDAASALRSHTITVARDQFARPDAGDYYWCDLVGCSVVTTSGEALGTLSEFLETGANDVMVVEGERERLVPFVLEHTVVDVDLSARRITVDWDADF